MEKLYPCHKFKNRDASPTPNGGSSHSIRARATLGCQYGRQIEHAGNGCRSGEIRIQFGPRRRVHARHNQSDESIAGPSISRCAAPRDRCGPPTQLSPIWFLYEDERLYFSIGLSSAKYRQLRRDPRIALCIDAGHPDARAVSISGTAELITDESPERADLEWRILRRYHESDEDAHRYESEVAEEGPSALVVVSPERIIGWDYN